MTTITLRDLAAIPVDRLKGVGDKKLASLAAVGIENVFDLLTTYPRRWVDRTNEARISDLVVGEGHEDGSCALELNGSDLARLTL